MPHLPPFDEHATFIAGREFDFLDDSYVAGDPIRSENIDTRRLRQLYENRFIAAMAVDVPYPEGAPAQMTPRGGIWFAITAPWLAEDEKVQGRDAAFARRAEVARIGVISTPTVNGWHVVTAPWHEAENTDTGLFEYNAHEQELADQEAARLIAEGPPKGFVLKSADDHAADRAAAKRAREEAAQAEADRLAAEESAAEQARQETEAEWRRIVAIDVPPEPEPETPPAETLPPTDEAKPKARGKAK